MSLSASEDSACGVCGEPLTKAHRVLSRHTTSEGVVTWVLCPCGALQARLRPNGAQIEQTVVTQAGASHRSCPPRRCAR